MMLKEEEVILVDSNDIELGTMGKMEAHRKGELHRAFSVFIFNTKGELLMQQRALEKYHSGGLWTNTCCSHPRKGETTLNAALRRMQEEMGIECDIKPVFNFIYKAHLDKGLIEHEFDHVFLGVSDSTPEINTLEVLDWKYESMENLSKSIRLNPENYTEWLKDCFDKVVAHFQDLKIS
ncbi:MAG: isopentenyl-diphosphate Delta-isomerase [Bacteroidetes bacterium]|nr:isopentenyl-diphosphate Delta-isomerase [Bacteroidota bacterium]